MIIYLTGSSSSDADKTSMVGLAQQLEHAGHTLSWPGALFQEEDIRDLGQSAPNVIFESCRIAMDRCACVVARLENGETNGGTAWEVGYAHAKGLPVYGLDTGNGRAGEQPSLAATMVQGCLAEQAATLQDLLDLLAEAGGSRAITREAMRRG